MLHPRQGNEARDRASRTARATRCGARPTSSASSTPTRWSSLSADAVYKLDYYALAEEHCEAGKAVTMVTTEVEPEDADRYGVVQVKGDKVTDYVYKPDEPEGNPISNEVFVFTPEPVLEGARRAGGGARPGRARGPRARPAAAARRRGRGPRAPVRWATGATSARSTRSTSATWSCCEDEPPIDLDDPAWPILTRAIANRASAQVCSGASIASSLIAPGAKVAGDVGGSVLGRGVVVEKGATVRDSVLLPGAIVRAGATVNRAIIDDHVDVRADVGEPGGAIALIGLHTTVDETLPAGARYPEVEDD